jgi:hypothetical protein
MITSCFNKILSICTVMIISVSTFAQIKHSVYFKSGQSTPDAVEMAKIHQWMAMSGLPQDVHLKLVGFADANNSNEYNLALSQRRAQSIGSILRSAGFTKITAEALGETSVATNEEDESSLALCRRVDIDASPSAIGEALSMSMLFDQKPFQHFEICPEKDNEIVCEGGIKVHFPIHCFEGSYSRMDTVDVYIREYLSAKEMILAGLTTSTSQGLIETGGSIEINAFLRNSPQKLELSSPIGVIFKDRNASDGMQTFYGNPQMVNGIIRTDWLPDSSDYDCRFNMLEFYNNPEFRKEALIKSHEVIDGNPEVIEVSAPPTKEMMAKNGLINYSCMGFEMDGYHYGFLARKHATYKWVKRENNNLVSGANDYYITSSRLGFINCDRWLNSNLPLTNMPLVHSEGNVYYLLYFADIKSLLPVYTGYEGLKFPNVPIGQKAILFAFGFRNGQYYFGEKPLKCSDVAVEVPVSISSKEEIEKRVAGL